MRIFGLTAYARSGEDTFADFAQAYLEDHPNREEPLVVERLSFAQALKDAVVMIDPILGFDPRTGALTRLSQAMRNYSDSEIKVIWPEHRRLLQVIGTDFIRASDTDFWARIVDNQIHALDETKTDIVFITDVRFPNEADMVRNLGGKIIRIYRDGVGPQSQHPSEVTMDDYPHIHHTIAAGSLDELRNHVHAIMDEEGFAPM